MPRVDTGKPNGRPTKKNAQAIARILKVARTGLPLKFAAQAGNIDAETLAQWRAKDPEFNQALSQARLAAVEEKWKLIQKAAQDRLDADGNLIKAGDWKSLAWSLERAYPGEFARPEVALNLAMQNNVTQNFLSISITAGEYAGIEAVADPVRHSVASMFSKYKPGMLGNGEGKVHDVEVTPAPEPESVITHQGDSDAQNPAFWKMLVTSNPESKIAKETATFAIRTLLLQTLGYKAHRMQIDFADDLVTLGDMFNLLEKLGGVEPWRIAQQFGGF